MRDLFGNGRPLPEVLFGIADDGDYLTDRPSKKALARQARTCNNPPSTPPPVETRQLLRARERLERKAIK